MAEVNESVPSVGWIVSNRSKLALANTEFFAGPLSPAEFFVLATLLASLSVVTVTGNALVMLSFYLDKSLRTHTNYFLLSLASSDMLIGVFAMPFYSYYLLRGEWTFGRILCDLWLTLDYSPSTASCLNLLVIGIDRYFSVTRPLWYRAKRTSRLVALMIGSVWVISFLLFPPWIWAWQYIDGRRTVPDNDCYVQFLETNFYLTMVTSLLHYYLPLALILFLYYGIWRETRKRKLYLVGMESERHCGTIREDSERISKCKQKSAWKFILWRCSGNNPESPKVTRETCSHDVRYPLWSAGKNSDPKLEMLGSEVVPPLRNVAYGSDLTESYSSVKDKMAKKDDFETRTTEGVFLAHASLSRGKGSRLDDTTSSLFPLVRKTEDNNDFDTGQFYPSRKVKTSSDLDETMLHSRAKEIPLVDISSEIRCEDINPELVFLRPNADERTDFILKDCLSSLKDGIIGSNENENHSGMCVEVPLAKPQSCLPREHCLTKHPVIIRDDHKAARVLTAILLAFMITTTPINVICIIKNLDHTLVPDPVWFFFYFLFYVNSTLNPVCYALANRHFKRTYWKILTCSWSQQEDRKSSYLSDMSLQHSKTCTTSL